MVDLLKKKCYTIYVIRKVVDLLQVIFGKVVIL